MAKKFLYTTYFNSNKPGPSSYGFSFSFTNDENTFKPENLQQTWFKWGRSWEDFDGSLKILVRVLTKRNGMSKKKFIKWLKEQCTEFGKQLYDNQSLGDTNPLIITAYVYVLKEIGGIPNNDSNGVSSIIIENDIAYMNTD